MHNDRSNVRGQFFGRNKNRHNLPASYSGTHIFKGDRSMVLILFKKSIFLDLSYYRYKATELCLVKNR